MQWFETQAHPLLHKGLLCLQALWTESKGSFHWLTLTPLLPFLGLWFHATEEKWWKMRQGQRSWGKRNIEESRHWAKETLRSRGIGQKEHWGVKCWRRGPFRKDFCQGRTPVSSLKRSRSICQLVCHYRRWTSNGASGHTRIKEMRKHKVSQRIKPRKPAQGRKLLMEAFFISPKFSIWLDCRPFFDIISGILPQPSIEE